MVKILERIGYIHIRTSGSHAILNKQDSVRGKITVPVPLHLELAKGTLKSIMRQTGLELKDLFNILGKKF
jgi:predicted RNA binding protein YcfA (HicA-like mRNA interferase family)